MGHVIFAFVVLLVCTPSQSIFPPNLSGFVFKPPETNVGSVGSPAQLVAPNPAPSPAPTPAIVNPVVSGGFPSAPAPAPASSPLSAAPSPTGQAPAPAPLLASSGNVPLGGFFNPTKTSKSPYGQISTNHVMDMNFGINIPVSFIKRVENEDDKYCQTHCLNDLQNCAVAVHCDWSAPTTTAAPCTDNIFQCTTFNRGGGATVKGVCLFFEKKTDSEDTDPGITSESNCKEVIYHPTCRDWTVGAPDHWVPTGRPTFTAGGAVSHSFLCEKGYSRSGVLKVICDNSGVKTPQSGSSCTKSGQSSSTGGGLPTVNIPLVSVVNPFPNRPSVVTTRKPDTTSHTTSSTTTTSPTTSSTTSSTTTTSPSTSSTTSSTTTTSPTTSSTTSSTTTTSPTTSSTTSSTTTTSPTTSSTTSSTTTTSPTTSSTTSSTTTTSPTTSSTTSSTTTTSPTTSSTTSSTTTTSPTTSSTTSTTTITTTITTPITTTTTSTTTTCTATTTPGYFYFMACQDFTINSVSKEETWKKHYIDDNYCHYYAQHVYDTYYPYIYCYASNWNSNSWFTRSDYMYEYVYDEDRRGKQCQDLCPVVVDWMNYYGLGRFLTIDTSVTCYYYGAYLYWPNNYYYWLDYIHSLP